MLPEILWQHEECGRWLSRAVTNLYPIVSPPAGRHEVIIDTPDHALPVDRMTADIWRNILAAYSARIRALSPNWPYLSLFRNVGKHAGGSLQHPHSQLIGLARTPGRIVSRHRRIRNAYRKDGHCILCETINEGGQAGPQIVAKSSAYVALVPETAEVPFEVWVVPVAHSSQFAFSDEHDQGALAHILHDVFHRMSAVLRDFDHNMMLMDAGREPLPYLHWFLRIRPVTVSVGGFELMTGISVNPSRPDMDAAMLRGDASVPGAAPAKPLV
jgi:UDPglucose--hexose-1-phosphate uridylyltransferase